MTGFVVASVVVFVIGLYIGVGAPGWPTKTDGERRHKQTRPLNPIAWGRTPGRKRQRPKGSDDRRLNLRRPE